MKKLLICSALALAFSATANADTNKEGQKWVGGFFERYSTDHAETGYPNFLDDGNGLGAEFGYRFTPEWATRLEVSSFDIHSPTKDYTSNRLGLDLMYFLPNDVFYAFGGLKRTKIVDDVMMLDLGLGKHWHINKNFRLITEVAAYQNLESGDGVNTHMGYKIGLAYAFGEGAAKPASARDSDRDGVNDSKDQCANTPYGTKVDATGCAIATAAAVQVGDSDGDGVLDNKDQCANTPSTDIVDAKGCSVFIEEQVSQDIKVLFANNSSIVNNPSDPQFKEFADFMKRFPSTDAVIEGHASAPGEASYNMMLSEKRAKSVRNLLVETYGVNASRLTAKGFGETQLLDSSNTSAAHKKNRRIVATVSASTRVKMTK
ncbi:OmpA family protein [Paraglaciecola aquimarina]|uniref:OmpA family protein n=1 Tax=Paraglaciecola algarum TaxID=3050085 RepID=A0ABS9D6W6_9ALTE|nr:OmpA family protein [Paraglaciecola sp. G1-23]MCF2947411.1 OmpA family protein [Paraglaciecola sp. G1-23]